MLSAVTYAKIAASTAKKAGRLLRQKFGKSKIAVEKSGWDFATDADLASEKLILNELKKATPKIPVLAEEGGGKALSWKNGYVWIVDPLDGTKNFQGGVPAWCVSIALLKDGKPIAGAIYVPLSDECYAAALGGGCTLNGKRLKVSSNAKTSEAVLMVELPRRYENRATLTQDVAKVSKLLKTVRRVRVLGAAALELALVARGVADAYVDLSGNTRIWDVAAGQLLVTEAGGKITDFREKTGNKAIVSVTATNGKLRIG